MQYSHRNGFGPTGVIFCVFFTFAAIGWAGTYSGGSGTAEDPYQISTKANWQELISTASDWDKRFTLLNDINFGGATINPVAPDNDPTEWNGFQGTAFTGVILGNGYALQNAVMNRPGIDYVGLIGQIGAGGQVIDLRIEAITVTARRFVGALVGEINGGSVLACSSSGTVSGLEYIGGLVGLVTTGRVQSSSSTCTVNASEHFLGGLVGFVDSLGVVDLCNSAGTVKGKSNTGGLIGSNGGLVLSSFTTGSVDGASAVGGLVGDNNYGWIYNCRATGTVTGSVQSIGGLVGDNVGWILAGRARGAVNGRWQFVGGLVGSNSGTIMASFATGAVSGGPIRGGLVGDEQGIVQDCFSAGLVNGTVSNLGGLIGQNAYGKVLDSFWDTEASGRTTSAGGTGKTTAEMKNVQTYLDAGWDFAGESANGVHDLWQILAGDYPRPAAMEWTLEGSGTDDDPYSIKTAGDLGKIWLRPEGYYQLSEDLDLTGIRWSMPVIPEFRGIFDGMDHMIGHLEVVIPDIGETGMFGHVSPGGVIRNVRLEDAQISGWYSVGALAGKIESGTIENSSSSGNVNGVENEIGGLVGTHYWGTLTGCRSSCMVTGGTSNIGGLVGYNNKGLLFDCGASGSVVGCTDSAGGLSGENTGTTTRCFATGSVQGKLNVGGLTGYGTGAVTDCYATGAVAGDKYVGGLGGTLEFGSIAGSFALGSVHGNSYIGGLVARKESYPITDCYARGEVHAIQNYVGGLLGENRGGNVSNCYSTGLVSGGSAPIGGLIGRATSGATYCSFWDTETSGLGSSGGGSGLTTVEMKKKANYIGVDWDFVGESKKGTKDVWRMCGDGVAYPRLGWEFSQDGDMACPDGVGMEDLVYLAGRWMAGTPATVGAADVDGNGKVDLMDFEILAANWMRE